MAESSPQQPREDESGSTEESVHFAPDSSGLLSEDQFLCSVCQNVFTAPGSVPCGPMKCISTCWGDSEQCHCPFCKEKFNKRPELEVNTAFREVVDLFKKEGGLNKPEVLCDACIGVKQKALKSCLDCRLTLCKSHLESHNNMPKIKEHKLISPSKNLEDYICQKHRRPLELFCRDDQMSACMVCTLTDHKKHKTVPVEEGIGEMKSQLEKTQSEVQHMIKDRLKKIKDIKHSVELRKVSTPSRSKKEIFRQCKKNMENELADSIEVLTALIRSVERSQAELLDMMEENQKAAESQAEDLIKDLEQEITELKRRDSELEQLFHTEDHLHLLQIYPSLCRPPHTKNWTDISIDPIIDLSVDILWNVVSQLQKSLNEMVTESEQRMIQQYAVDVTLDADTAHPKLILSDDGKQVRNGDTEQKLPDNPKRFNRSLCALGKEGFSSGRFYYEVQVSGKTEWDLGVARESINRKHKKVILTPQNGFWAMKLRNGNEYKACVDALVPLFVREKLQKVGVFVNYEEGLVSFYDAESRSRIFSFTGQTFTEKLYPYFSPRKNDRGKNSAPLIISPVSKTE
ncbi:E3 ubiquitin-protein ligase TRIM39-like isoform X1 [Pygocentrus nattereri]|uniref:E3 ubiquitin-protein ligase TRIM39-like isoform X1 n=2 Tax=Pygocentrus nattereri TaxID=42514 RepID=UPI000814742F|nr:E3 ubiquitin-protein ligase TRIM39-like isoform X1 [Pygocentrus nattereri]XP_017574529.1 E3 ubiquitin-protein ligase TRIM39-like isoform X1 [Pygocentrus nattereri]